MEGEDKASLQLCLRAVYGGMEALAPEEAEWLKANGLDWAIGARERLYRQYPVPDWEPPKEPKP